MEYVAKIVIKLAQVRIITQRVLLSHVFHKNFMKVKWGKREIFSITEKIFREMNYFVNFLVEILAVDFT